jgi:uncharacterized protein YjbI with pentapeptide repeats
MANNKTTTRLGTALRPCRAFVMLHLTALAFLMLSALAAHALTTTIPAPIQIERPGFTATIEVVQESWLDKVWKSAELPLAAGLIFVVIGLGVFAALQQRRMKGLETRMTLATSNNLGKLITDLCDRNRLVRLAAVQQLGALGHLSTDAGGRVLIVLGAYLKALCSDTQLRGTTSIEIVATLQELTALRRGLAQKRPTTLDLSGMDFSGLSISDMDFSDTVLSGSSFRGATLRNTNFQNAQMQRVDFSHASISGANFAGANISDALWIGAKVENCLALSPAEIEASTKVRLISGGKAQSGTASPEHIARRKQLALAAFHADLQAPQDKSKLH